MYTKVYDLAISLLLKINIALLLIAYVLGVLCFINLFTGRISEFLGSFISMPFTFAFFKNLLLKCYPKIFFTIEFYKGMIGK